MRDHSIGAGGRRDRFTQFITPHDGENVDAKGVPIRFHYWLLSIFAFCVAIGPLAFSLAPGGEELRNPITQSQCIGGLVFSVLIVFYAKRTGYVFKEWLFQLALYFSLLGCLQSNLVTPNMIAPFMALYLLPPLGGAIYLSTRKAIPLVGASVATILFISTRVDAPNAMLRGMILAIVAIGAANLTTRLMARLAYAVENNREISERDPLTGAYNMRRFEQRLSDEISRVLRDGSGFALAMFDLDNFKQVNDSYNHSIGDEVLVATAEAINSSLKPVDLLARRGGDEFAVIIPTSPERDPQAIVELARKRIEHARREICPELTPYASAGWVAYQPPETAQEFLERADIALHSAKEMAPERRGHKPEKAIPLVAGAAIKPDVADDLRRSRSDRNALRDDPIRGLIAVCWTSSAWVIGASSIAVVAMVLAGQTTFDFSTMGIVVLVSWLVVFAPFVYWASKRNRPLRYINQSLAVAAFALITAGCLVIGDAAPTLIDLYIFAIVLFATLLPYKQLTILLAIGIALYGYFLYASQFPYAEIRLTIMSMIVLLSSVVLSTTRHRTIIAAREKAQLARIDALTSLPNTRRLNDRIEEEIRRYEITGDRFALLMLDLDDFKSVNDRYSHSLGDEVLVDVAKAISSVCRHADMPVRRGGDEFAVLMTDADENDAILAAERVANAIQAARQQVVADINPNASVGWVVWHPADTVDEVIARADTALHEKKAESHRERFEYAAVG